MKILHLKQLGALILGAGFWATAASGQTYTQDFESIADRDGLISNSFFTGVQTNAAWEEGAATRPETTVKVYEDGTNVYSFNKAISTDELDLVDLDRNGQPDRSLRLRRAAVSRQITPGWAAGYVPSNGEPFVYRFWFYDPMTKAVDPETGEVIVDEDTGEEVLAQGNNFATIRPAAAASFVSVGLYPSWGITGQQTYDVKRYQARIMGSNPEWIQLDAERQPGWNEVEVVIHNRAVDIYVNGVLDPKATGRPRAAGAILERFTLGSGISSNLVPLSFGKVETYQIDEWSGSAQRPYRGRELHMTTQPSSRTIARGDNATFTVAHTELVTAGGQVVYQWYRDGEPLVNGGRISGANSATLTIAEVQDEDASLRVQVRIHDSRTPAIVIPSNLVALNVIDPPPPATGIRFADFEGLPVQGTNGSVLFRQPSLSGSTSARLEPTPNDSWVVSDYPPNAWGDRALRVAFRFRENLPTPWLRLTTNNATVLPNPTIGFDRYLRFDIHPSSDVYLMVGVRESNSTAQYGAPSPLAGVFEWVGAEDASLDGTVLGVPPKGKLAKANQWTTLFFDMANDPVVGWNLDNTAINGNGVLEGQKGLLEHLAIVPAGASDGSYTKENIVIYLDNFEVTEVGPPPPPVDEVAPMVSISRGAGTSIELFITGGANATHEVHVSSDLVTWTKLADVTLNGDGAGEVIDSEGTSLARRFYRVQ